MVASFCCAGVVGQAAEYRQHQAPVLVPVSAHGYARVSTRGQILDSQLGQLRAAGCSSRNTYREEATDARPDRRELNRMLGKLAPRT
jgi:hypothetical protein